MTDAANSDYSWSVPNRRFIDSGLYLPSIRSEGMEAIAVIRRHLGLDTIPATLAEPSGPRCARSPPRSGRKASS